MSEILYLFPDTNLFIQCQPLQNLDWSQWTDFDEVRLIVSSPVLREIDNQKNRGNDRIGRRARTSNTLFRDLLNENKDHMVIREANPTVKLYINDQYRPDSALAEQLDYSERDDQLIGTVYAFLNQNAGADVRLLTDDVMPTVRARSQGIEVVAIPKSWRLPLEKSKEEKQIEVLSTEVARLKMAEPQVKIHCLNGYGEEIERIEIALERYTALTGGHVSAFMDCISGWYPAATTIDDSEARKPIQYDDRMKHYGIVPKLIPPTNEEIKSYSQKEHPQWLKSCEDFLRNLHENINRRLIIPYSFIAENIGTRPAKDVLVTIEAKGNILIIPREREAKNEGKLKLPRPPKPPSLRYDMHPYNIDEIMKLNSQGIHDFDIHPLRHGTPKHDPNAFYYKPNRPRAPQSSFSLECDQWRHGEAVKRFEGEISFSSQESGIAGVIECRIHAENLSNVAVRHLPVRISISPISVLSRAEELVAELNPKFTLKLK